MEWIQPLQLETWLINVFSGNPDIFGSIMLIILATLAGYFRMSGISMFFMMGIFVILFSGYIGVTFTVLFAIIGGLLVGYWISKLVKN